MKTCVSTLSKVYPTRRWIGALVAGLVAAVLGMAYAQDPIRQPLPFSHRVHAGGGAKPMACAACHPGQGRKKGIVGAAACMSCHKTVARDRPAIAELARAAAAGKAIAWEPVYTVPDFVWFSHRQHGRHACAVCHGPVETRDVLAAEIRPRMKFCRACHVRNGAKAVCGTCHYER